MSITRINLTKFSHNKTREIKFPPFFKVNEVRLIREDNGEPSGERALVNDSTNKIVGRVSNRYNVTTHEYASNLIKEIVDAAGLQYESLGAQTSNGGSRFFETLVFPSLKFNMAQDQASTAFDNFGLQVDDVFPSITAKNSYDKTSPVAFNYGTYQLKCRNGMCLPLNETRLTFKHTQVIDIPRIKDVLLMNLEQSKKLTDLVYNRLNGEAGVSYLIDLFANKSFPNKFKKALMDRMNALDKTVHIEYKEVTDPKTGLAKALEITSITTQATAYAVYNVATEIASHVLTNRSEQEVAGNRISDLFVAKIAN
jgi:hypothetical protein